MKNILLVFVFINVSILYADDRDKNYDYYGNWKVNSYFYVEGVMAFITNEDAKKYIGEIVTYAPDYVLFRNKKYRVMKKIYNTYYDNNALFKETTGGDSRGLTFLSLGIKGVDEIRFIILDIDSDKFEDIFFDWLLVVNNNRIIIHHDGYCFEATRVKQKK